MIVIFQNIDGVKFLALSKEQIVNLTGMKVGPSIKIYDLIQALKARAARGRPSADTDPDTGAARITASVLLKQQGLLQTQDPEIMDSSKAPLLGRHLLTNSPTVASKHSLALKAQPSQ